MPVNIIHVGISRHANKFILLSACGRCSSMMPHRQHTSHAASGDVDDDKRDEPADGIMPIDVIIMSL